MISNGILPALLVLALQSSPLLADAVPAPEMKPPVQESLPAGAQIESLDVQPPKVAISGKFEAAQLVVTAKLSSGENVDATDVGVRMLGSVCKKLQIVEGSTVENGGGMERLAGPVCRPGEKRR